MIGIYPQLLICAQKIGDNDSDRASDSDGDIPKLVVYPIVPSLVACALSLPYPHNPTWCHIPRRCLKRKYIYRDIRMIPLG